VMPAEVWSGFAHSVSFSVLPNTGTFTLFMIAN
jgi:hypothetical protein